MGLVQVRFVPPYLLAAVAMATMLVGGRAGARLSTLGEAIRGDAQATEAYGSLPLAFEPNDGQARAGVRFLARGSGYGLALTRTGAILALHKPSLTNARGTERGRQRDAALRLRFLGANEGVRLAASRPLPGKVNYLLGNDPSKWLTGIDTFGEVRYRGLYPGVDARFYGRQGRLEYDLIVAPGADPSRIELALSGARTLRLDARGNLLVRLPGGTLVQQRAHIYQLIDGRRQPVAGRYVLHGGERFGFRLGPYDSRRPLVIDPVARLLDLPRRKRLRQRQGHRRRRRRQRLRDGLHRVDRLPDDARAPSTPASTAACDAFVTKLSADRREPRLLHLPRAEAAATTGCGHRRGRRGQRLRDGADRVARTSRPRPAPSTPPSTAAHDAFVAKLDPTGSSLVYSTYLGGSGDDDGCGDRRGRRRQRLRDGDTDVDRLPDHAGRLRHHLQRRRRRLRDQARRRAARASSTRPTSAERAPTTASAIAVDAAAAPT